MFRLKLAGGAVVLGLGLMGVQKVDHRLNYVPVTASITSVSSTCYLTQISRGVVTKSARTTGPMPCARAEALKGHHAAYQSMTVTGSIDTQFDYVSPVDRAQHSASLSYAYEDYNRLAGLSVGKNLPVLANKFHAGSVAHDHDNLGAFETAEPAAY